MNISPQEDYEDIKK